VADRRLQVFHTVARLLSFTKAADALHMTQPAVTFQVRQLEEYFNTRLFDRTHNRISLTVVGQKVYEYAEEIFERYADMENAVKQLTGDVSGTLVIGASTTIAEYMLPNLLGDFKSKYPDIKLSLQVGNTENIVSMVEDNIIDLGVVEAPVLNKSLAVILCHTDPLVAVLPKNHPLAKKTSITPAELFKDNAYICREEGSGTREVVQTYIEAHGVDSSKMNIAMELGSPEAIKGAVEGGMGVSILSRSTLDKEIQLGSLAVITLKPTLERPFSFVHQKQKFRLQAMNELLSFACEYCEKNK
jgi:DNA-binding transcriptional LysR family regulator